MTTTPNPTGEAGAVILRQIGVSDDGHPLYAYRDTTPAPMPGATLAARPWGAYVALGIAGAGAITFVAMAAAILAVAIAIGGVSATVCLLVLRSMWEKYREGDAK